MNAQLEALLAVDRHDLSVTERAEFDGALAADPDALPLAQQGQNRKKALVVISDGNDTASTTSVRDVKAQVRETEVLVYAIGIDGVFLPGSPMQDVVTYIQEHVRCRVHVT